MDAFTRVNVCALSSGCLQDCPALSLSCWCGCTWEQFYSCGFHLPVVLQSEEHCWGFSSQVKLDVDIKLFNKPESVRVVSILALCRKKNLRSSFCMTVGTHHTWSFMGCTKSFQRSAWHLDNKSPFSSDGNWTSEMPMWFQNSVYVDRADLALLPCLCDMIT